MKLVLRATAALLLAGASVSTAGCKMAVSSVKGHASSSGGSLGTFQLTPDRCESGKHWSFHGVAMFIPGETGSKIEAVNDPLKGWFVKVGKPGASQMDVFGSDACKQLLVEVHEIPTSGSKRIPRVSGSLKFDCKRSSGEHVTGDLTFESCG